jgi:hypothetical protein
MNLFHSDSSSKGNANGGIRTAENGGSGSQLRHAKRHVRGLGDDASDALIYDMLIDEPVMYLLSRCEQKGCWV